MKKVIFIFLMLLGAVAFLQAQDEAEQKTPFTFSVFSNSTQLPPALLPAPLHPGLCLGIEKHYKRTDKSLLFQSYHAGIFYHHLAQTAVQLYSGLGYRHTLFSGFSADARLLAGGLLSFPDVGVYVHNEGSYTSSTAIRLQAMAGVGLGLNKDLKIKDQQLTAFVNYQFWFQMPFVKGYVPVLPNVAFHVGISVPVF